VRLPSLDEITAARAGIDREGPESPVTIGLCRVVQVSSLCGNAERIAAAVVRATEAAPDNRILILQAAIASAIATGLNYGLRIGEAR
jgi:hypothetical protein